MEHIPVMLQSVIHELKVVPDGFYVDATFGRGGYSKEILAQLTGSGQLFSYDLDPEAVATAKEIKHNNFNIYHCNYADFDKQLPEDSKYAINGIVADLGVSSPQLDNAIRGFSFKKDGPLDMRMDPSRGETAKDFVNNYSEAEIANVIYNYGEEHRSRQIAKKIVLYRKTKTIETTKELAAIVATVVRPSRSGKDPATKTFQAIRIHINNELNALETFISKAINSLASGGRMVVVTFHSLEDRLVKSMFNRFSGKQSFLEQLKQIKQPEQIIKLVKKVKACEQEVKSNVRARSAIMRVVEKL